MKPPQKPEITYIGPLDLQVCVPKEWTEEEIIRFAESKNPSGVVGGWHIRREGSRLLDGAPERVACRGRSGFVHVMLDVLDDVV